ncbi:hypothetical protein QZH41_014154 [Actinostola sp. cb2023]|nr:hypothetical protein QZH41_014154 [Actinostola sp. cb2023]
MAENTDVLVKKEPGNDSMFEGKNIHSSPIDGKLLCSYSEKLCKQRRLNGYAFCIRHVLEDKNAPFKQCQYVAKYNGQQCTNPIPFPEDRIYCNSHLQVLGLVPKKTRRKKASESQDTVDKESTHSMRDSQPRADVSTIVGHQNMPFISPVVHQHRHKKQKTKIQKKEPDIPAISELKECLKTSKRDREDLFESYGIDSSDDSDSSYNESVPWQQVWLPPDNGESGMTSSESERYSGIADNKDFQTKLSSRLRRELHQLRRSLRNHRYRHPLTVSTAAALLKAAQSDVPASVDSVVENSKTRTSPPMCVIKKCAFSSEDISCHQNAMPYTKYCSGLKYSHLLCMCLIVPVCGRQLDALLKRKSGESRQRFLPNYKNSKILYMTTLKSYTLSVQPNGLVDCNVLFLSLTLYTKEHFVKNMQGKRRNFKKLKLQRQSQINN